VSISFFAAAAAAAAATARAAATRAGAGGGAGGAAAAVAAAVAAVAAVAVVAVAAVVLVVRVLVLVLLVVLLLRLLRVQRDADTQRAPFWSPHHQLRRVGSTQPSHAARCAACAARRAGLRSLFKRWLCFYPSRGPGFESQSFFFFLLFEKSPE